MVSILHLVTTVQVSILHLVVTVLVSIMPLAATVLVGVHYSAPGATKVVNNPSPLGNMLITLV